MANITAVPPSLSAWYAAQGQPVDAYGNPIYGGLLSGGFRLRTKEGSDGGGTADGSSSDGADGSGGSSDGSDGGSVGGGTDGSGGGDPPPVVNQPVTTIVNPSGPAANPFYTGPDAASINSSWKMSQPLQNQLSELLTNPVSGYSPVANYGAQLGRFQFSHTAPVPATAPVGWGRYPGTGGAPPPPKWLTNPTTPPLPTANPPGSYVGGGGSSGGSGNGAGNGGYTSAYPPGYTPGTTPPSTQGWMPGPATSQVSSNTLSGFKFANAAPGSVQANFNAIQAKYGPNDAINYLIRNGYTNGAWSQFTNALKAGGMSSEDISRITNQYSAGGAGGVFNNSLEGFNGGVYSNGTDITGLLASLGIKDTSASDALAAMKAQRKARLGR